MRKRYDLPLVKKAKKLYINGLSQENICIKLNIPHGSIWKLLNEIPINQRKRLPKGFKQKHLLNKKSLLMSKEKARIIGYLASEGHVAIKTYRGKRIHYTKKGPVLNFCTHNDIKVAFYNKESSLIERFLKDFYKVYNKKPRYDKKRIEIISRSVEIYKDLTRYCNYSSTKWTIPKEILNNQAFKKEWLKAFCDGEAYIESRINSPRITINSVNKKGLNSIKEEILKDLEITCKIYGPYYREKFKIFRLTINGKDNLKKYNEKIGFNHLKKKETLINILGRI